VNVIFSNVTTTAETAISKAENPTVETAISKAENPTAETAK
jgi:hypothetical protein